MYFVNSKKHVPLPPKKLQVEKIESSENENMFIINESMDNAMN
jgi:hypothetical protein